MQETSRMKLEYSRSYFSWNTGYNPSSRTKSANMKLCVGDSRPKNLAIYCAPQNNWICRYTIQRFNGIWPLFIGNSMGTGQLPTHARLLQLKPYPYLPYSTASLGLETVSRIPIRLWSDSTVVGYEISHRFQIAHEKGSVWGLTVGGPTFLEIGRHLWLYWIPATTFWPSDRQNRDVPYCNVNPWRQRNVYLIIDVQRAILCRCVASCCQQPVLCYCASCSTQYSRLTVCGSCTVLYGILQPHKLCDCRCITYHKILISHTWSVLSPALLKIKIRLTINFPNFNFIL